jgi:flagellar export protein FliJ
MPKFVFRLDALLRLRQAERDQHRRELAAVLAAEESLRPAREALATELQLLATACRRTGAIDTTDLLAREAEGARLRASLAKLENQRAELLERFTAQQTALKHADAQVGALEKLRERRELEWRRASAAGELKNFANTGQRAAC